MTTRITQTRPALIAGLATIVLGGSVAALATGEQPGANDGQAQAVAAAPDITFAAPSVTWAGEDIADRASVLMSGVPLPRGGNFNGVRWPELGTASDDDIQFLLQFNAACQWLRASDEGRDADRQEAIWAALPNWPAMRLSGWGQEFLAARAAAAEQSDRAVALLERCEESRQREVSYAVALQRAPTR